MIIIFKKNCQDELVKGRGDYDFVKDVICLLQFVYEL